MKAFRLFGVAVRRPTVWTAFTLLLSSAAFGQLSQLTYANATSADPAPHAVNEVSMVVTPTYNLQTGGMTDTVYAAYMRYPAQQNGPYSNNVSVGTVGGTWTLKPPPTPQDPRGSFFPPGTMTGDPVLATNPTGSELHPYRVYLASTTISGGTNQISLWTLDAGYPGANWVFRRGFDYQFNGGPLNDKPAISVSQAPSTLGHAYLTYLRDGKVHFWRQTAPDTWTDKGIIYPGPNDPQANGLGATRVDVDNEFGSVLVSFLDFSASRVYILQSFDEGNTWTKFSSPTYCADDPQCHTCQLLTNNNGKVCSDPSCVYAPTQLHTFWAYRTLELVYHQRKLDGTGSEVVMRSFYHPAQSWYPVHKVSSQSSTHDSWQGAVTCHNSGSCAVAFYDHAPGDPGNNYRFYDRVLNIDGSPLTNLNDVLLYPTASDANVLVIQRMEYHDFFLLNDKWYTANVFTSGNGSADVLVTRQTWW